MNVYKYTKAAYAKKMIEEGFFRLGTLDDYKNIEKHGEEVGDQDEGKLTTKMDRHLIDSRRPETLSPVAHRILNSGRIVGGQVIIVTEQIMEHTDNCLIYSTSRTANKDIMRSINPEYDTCVEIKDIHSFFKLLSDCLKQKFPDLPGAFGDFCTYSSRIQHHTQQLNIHPAFIKELKHSYQQEHRVIWQLSEINFDYYDLKCMQASKYCSILSL